MATGIYDDQDSKQQHYDREFDSIVKHYNDEVTPRRDLKRAEESAGEDKNLDNGDDLRERENGAGGGWKTSLADNDDDSDDDGQATGARKKRKRSGKGLKRGLLLGGIGGGVLLVLVVLGIIFMFLSQFKNIHFAELGRSIGLARFNYTMRRDFTRTIFDAATLTDNSTGSLAAILQDGRKGLPKQLKQLGIDGTLKFDVQRGSVWDQLRNKNTLAAIEVNGTRYTLDDYSDKAFGKKFDDLSYRERLTVRAQYNNAIRTNLNDALYSNSRWFRWKTYGALRQIAGIRMFKWADKAREYFGKSPPDARKLDVDETIAAVDEGDSKAKTGIDVVDEEADQAKENAKKAAETGSSTDAGQVRTRWAKYLRTTTKVSDAVFVTTAACIVDSLAKSMDNAQEQTQKKALRLGHDAMTSADQTKEGDTVAEAVGADSARWDNAEKAVLYKQATGEGDLTKDDQQQISDIPNIEGPVGTFKDVIDGVDGFIKSAVVGGPIISSIIPNGWKDSLVGNGCNVLLNQYVQYSIAGTELLVSVVSAGATKGIIAGVRAAVTGGLAAAGSIGLGELLGTLMDKAVGTTSGLDYSGTLTGVPLYNQTQVGINSLDSYGERTVAYGAPASKKDTAEVQQQAMLDIHQQNSQLPFTQRYFAIDNPYSLTGKLIAIAPSNLSGLSDMVRSGFASLASIFSTPQHMLATAGNALMPHQFAFAEQNAKTDLIGLGGDKPWVTTEEEEKLMDTPDFDWQANQDYYDAHKDQLEQDYGKCYQEGSLQSQIPDDCYKDGYLTSTAARHYRFYKKTANGGAMLTGDVQ